MQRKGFTVIELLLVIAIIISISALMLPVMFGVRMKALVVGCQSNLRQVDNYLQIYSINNDENIPRTVQDVEARNDSQKLKQLSTGIPSLRGLVKKVSGNDGGALKVLRCPADSGSHGQEYYPTGSGETCFEAYGQSQQINVEMYTSPNAPGYNALKDGPMYGGNAVKRPTENPAKFMVLSDMYMHWHGGVTFGDDTAQLYGNLLHYDGHVSGKGFSSVLDAKTFLNRDDVKRWWIPEPLPE